MSGLDGGKLLKTPKLALLGGAKDHQGAHQSRHDIPYKVGTSLASVDDGLQHPA